jgi:inner membrane protein
MELRDSQSGALLARATAGKNAPPRSMARRVAAGFFACAAPDLDIVLSYAGPAVYLEQHRGVTHSELLLPLWALLLSWLLSRILREPGGWRALYGVTALALAAHIAGDLITGFGTIVFAPLSDWRAALGTTFIIDLWFTGIIVAGLLLSLVFRRTRVPAIAASAALAGYVGFQYIQKQHALELGQQHAASLGLTNATGIRRTTRLGARRGIRRRSASSAGLPMCRRLPARRRARPAYGSWTCAS